jgi:hypothetical protein
MLSFWRVAEYSLYFRLASGSKTPLQGGAATFSSSLKSDKERIKVQYRSTHHIHLRVYAFFMALGPDSN